jgi:hypothetical protein
MAPREPGKDAAARRPPDGDAEAPPLLDQRRGTDRRKGERRQKDVPVAADRRTGKDRRKGPRRVRSINQYDLDQEELEFVNAVNRFRERAGKRFPTAKDLLQILRELGYEKRA